MKSLISQTLFGSAVFEEREEYQEFQYKFLIVLLVFGALFTSVFIVADSFQLNPLGGPHMRSMAIFSTVALVLAVTLRGRQHLFKPVAWVYEAVCLLEYSSALVYVPADELRVLWFFVNIPGVFILLGTRAGWFITLGTCVGLSWGNAYIPASYSVPAMATSVVAMLNMGAFFHAYSNRSISYFNRMRDYNARLHQLATHDPLTGVMNARAYYERCDQLISAASRRAEGFSVLFLDLDHFKLVNDTYGHAAGDLVLKSVANTVRSSLRRSDAMGRVGGEEFSVFLPATASQQAADVAEAIRQAIERSMPDIGDHQLRVTASIGVASCEGELQTMQAIQKQADEAMYVAKSVGRNRVSLLGRA